ncbi:hypothetical protein GE061_006609 [Apolygus lucorum]|uniref:Uncharacterized protein n=1 Tax=Apolygus lucorum TaxID=248454 RepID=A0A8S9WWY1_APOLU|nr:hypothetical protein GE061_006609 [Apolygus lucorum]
MSLRDLTSIGISKEQWCVQIRSSCIILLYDVRSESSDAVNDMNSCFPPLAALSLHGSQPKTSAPSSRIEVLQDLDLYYIKQIAHNLKASDILQRSVA